MRSTHRRQRTPNPLATAAAVRAICDELRKSCPDIPKSHKKLVSLLNAVRHIGRYPSADIANQRPTKWQRAILLKVAENLRQILARGTSGRVSISSFIGLYLRILDYPSDLQSALESGDITLQEATMLARLSHQKLQLTPVKAATLRRQVIEAHIKSNGSQTSMRLRIKEILGEADAISSQTISAAVEKVDELLKVDPADKRHLFYEQFKDLFFALREIQPTELDDKTLAEFSKLTDQLATFIYSIKHKHKQRAEAALKFHT